MPNTGNPIAAGQKVNMADPSDTSASSIPRIFTLEQFGGGRERLAKVIAADQCGDGYRGYQAEVAAEDEASGEKAHVKAAIKDGFVILIPPRY